MDKHRKKKSWKKTLLILVIILIILILYNGFKTPIPEGSSQKGEIRDSDVQFYHDLTFEKDGSIVYEQNIFPKMKEMIADASNFIVIDMFLFNDEYDPEYSYRNISGELTETLVAQKNKYPDLEIVFITDEINTFYDSYPSKYLKKLKENGIRVVITELEETRDPNPLYAGIWRTFFTKLDTSKGIRLPNAISEDSPKVTLASYLKSLNMKANHRKVLITENEALVSSLNPHDASSNHSNFAIGVKGEIINDLLESENKVVEFSDGTPINFNTNTSVKGKEKAQILTEGKIKEELIKEIKATQEGDKIKMALFYLSERELLKELIAASDRGVDIKIILDANKDALGKQKVGIPNRPVAYKLTNDSENKISVRWYNTYGEQFHSKVTIISKKEETIVIGGSANLTRRNIGDYTLETDLKVILQKGNPKAREIEEYFARIWSNEDAEYTLDLEAYEEHSALKNFLYYVQERTGLSSF